MKRRTSKRIMRKVSLSFVIIILLLSTIGMAYSIWLTQWDEALKLFLSCLIIAVAAFISATAMGD